MCLCETVNKLITCFWFECFTNNDSIIKKSNLPCHCATGFWPLAPLKTRERIENPSKTFTKMRNVKKKSELQCNQRHI